MKTITYDELLNLFKEGYLVDETIINFKTEQKGDHYLGYRPELDKPYWTGDCDLEDGFCCTTAEELFNAPIFNGKTIKDRWDDIIVTHIGGIWIDDWFKYVK